VKIPNSSGKMNLVVQRSQYRHGTAPEITHKDEKRLEMIGSSSKYVKSANSIPTGSKDNIIDVYVRSKENIAVPDQRTGVDRRRSFGSQLSFPASPLEQLHEKANGIGLYAESEQFYQSCYDKAGKIPSEPLPLSGEKAKFIDIWV